MVGRMRKISAEWMGKQDTLAYSTEPSGWAAPDPGYATTLQKAFRISCSTSQTHSVIISKILHELARPPN